MRKILAYFGSTLLLIGCFLPMLSTPDKTYNFFDTIPIAIPGIPPNAMQFAGILIMLTALTAAILTFTSKLKLTWIAGVITIVTMTCVYYGFHTKLNEMKEQANTQLGNLLGGMFKDVTETLFQSVQLGGAGWYAVGSGALLLVVSSLPFTRN